MTETLQRRRPDPLPPIHPLPERLAEGARKRLYEDTKTILQVPWMGVVTMAIAHYPNFSQALWEGQRALCQSASFVAACARLRAVAEAEARKLNPFSIRGTLTKTGYDQTEVADIAALIEVFSHGNMAYLLLATQARLLLEGHRLSSERAAPPCADRHGPGHNRRLTLIEAHHADPSLAALYAEIREALGLPFVNTDYRALARWPSYLALAWRALRPRIPTETYAAALEAVHAEAVHLALSLPNPSGLTPDDVRIAADKDGTAAEIGEVVALFQWLLPGLVINIATFREQIADR